MDRSLKSVTRLEGFKEWIPKVLEVRNYTSHEINIDDGNVDILYDPEDNPIRIAESLSIIHIAGYNGHEIVNKKMGRLDLPKFDYRVLNIVSLPVAQLIAQKFKERLDFVTIGEVIRDDKGNVVGCRNLAFIE